MGRLHYSPSISHHAILLIELEIFKNLHCSSQKRHFGRGPIYRLKICECWNVIQISYYRLRNQLSQLATSVSYISALVTHAWSPLLLCRAKLQY